MTSKFVCRKITKLIHVFPHVKVVFVRVLCEQLLGFLPACGIPIRELCLIYPECFVRLSLRVKNFGAHVPCAQPQRVFGATVQNLFAD